MDQQWVNQPVPQNISPLEMLLSQPDAFTAAALRNRNSVKHPQQQQQRALALLMGLRQE